MACAKLYIPGSIKTKTNLVPFMVFGRPGLILVVLKISEISVLAFWCLCSVTFESNTFFKEIR